MIGQVAARTSIGRPIVVLQQGCVAYGSGTVASLRTHDGSTRRVQLEHPIKELCVAKDPTGGHMLLALAGANVYLCRKTGNTRTLASGIQTCIPVDQGHGQHGQQDLFALLHEPSGGRLRDLTLVRVGPGSGLSVTLQLPIDSGMTPRAGVACIVHGRGEGNGEGNGEGRDEVLMLALGFGSTLRLFLLQLSVSTTSPHLRTSILAHGSTALCSGMEVRTLRMRAHVIGHAQDQPGAECWMGGVHVLATSDAPLRLSSVSPFALQTLHVTQITPHGATSPISGPLPMPVPMFISESLNEVMAQLRVGGRGRGSSGCRAHEQAQDSGESWADERLHSDGSAGSLEIVMRDLTAEMDRSMEMSRRVRSGERAIADPVATSAGPVAHLSSSRGSRGITLLDNVLRCTENGREEGRDSDLEVVRHEVTTFGPDAVCTPLCPEPGSLLARLMDIGGEEDGHRVQAQRLDAGSAPAGLTMGQGAAEATHIATRLSTTGSSCPHLHAIHVQWTVPRPRPSTATDEGEASLSSGMLLIGSPVSIPLHSLSSSGHGGTPIRVADLLACASAASVHPHTCNVAVGSTAKGSIGAIQIFSVMQHSGGGEVLERLLPLRTIAPLTLGSPGTQIAVTDRSGSTADVVLAIACEGEGTLRCVSGREVGQIDGKVDVLAEMSSEIANAPVFMNTHAKTRVYDMFLCEEISLEDAAVPQQVVGASNFHAVSPLEGVSAGATSPPRPPPAPPSPVLPDLRLPLHAAGQGVPTPYMPSRRATASASPLTPVSASERPCAPVRALSKGTTSMGSVGRPVHADDLEFISTSLAPRAQSNLTGQGGGPGWTVGKSKATALELAWRAEAAATRASAQVLAGRAMTLAAQAIARDRSEFSDAASEERVLYESSRGTRGLEARHAANRAMEQARQAVISAEDDHVDNST